MDKKIYHSFDIAMAKGYGLRAAIVFNYLKIRIEHIKSLGCEKCAPYPFHSKKRVWFVEEFLMSVWFLHYLSAAEILDSLNILSGNGLILIKGDVDKFNFTEEDCAGKVWYAFPDDD